MTATFIWVVLRMVRDGYKVTSLWGVERGGIGRATSPTSSTAGLSEDEKHIRCKKILKLYQAKRKKIRKKQQQ